MRKIVSTLSLVLLMNMMNAQDFKIQTLKDNKGYTYETVNNDPDHVRVYTLKNGLKVFLAKNTDAPRIQTYIPVRTGSNNDPADNTGLAHYLEHMVFKGTSKLGTKDWTKEKALIQQISDLYEAHKAEKDPAKKREIYKKIDAVSQEASKYAIANEYDKATSSIGATGTNAHTWLDETVYKNNIPNNELEKWFKIEKERFSELVLRLFHTELEAVYEEYNRAQDNDGRLVNYELMSALFPKHPNGQQTTIGTAEHLKNPSMVAINKYFDTYYVPNNMAVVLVGDLDFDKTIELADKYFGTFQYKELPMKKMVSEEPMTKIVEKTVKSPTTPRLQMAWRTDSYGSNESRLAEITAQILSNSGEVGLLDTNVNQQQKALRAVAYNSPLKTYGYFTMVIVPKEGQSMQDAKQLLLQQIDLIKKGEFPDWMIPSIIEDMKLSRMRQLETADGLATNLYDTYIKGRSWDQELNEINEYSKITKADIVKFANDFFKDNYVVVYKEKGVNDKLVRVENPGITPIQLNKDAQSPFLKEIISEKVSDIAPVFVDFKKEIKETAVKGVKLSYIQNKTNDIAQMNYIFNFGTDNDKELGLALNVLEYLGTDKYSPEQLKAEFYKIGISYNLQIGADRINVSLSGPEKNIGKGLALVNHWIQNVKPDQEIYNKTVKTILEGREIAKKDKARIMAALSNYAKFGKDSRFRDVISKERLTSIKAEEITNKIKSIAKYPYELFFYGKDLGAFEKEISGYVQKASLKYPAAKIYPELPTGGQVYFTNYDMVQMEMSKIGRGEEIKPANFGKINVFNEYFGRGLSSIVFQEIRESRSLAYSAYVNYAYPDELKKHDYVTTYIGTQANKLPQAVSAMNELMEELPQIQVQFDNAKGSALKQIASNRITKRNIYFNYLRMKKLGIDYDIRKDIYNEVKDLTLPQLSNFYNTEVKPVNYNTAIIGKKENLDMNAINKLGTFREVSLEEIFGY
ncbi:M16 family metallopeptidase [Elizabethkingia anophelis]|uniref:M16 family metallopeptidase n=1 Tax=Elizabethkingia anophelis TaxID=1117645 RepID=UPI0009D674A2|nr:M16 family metallopeptidase [Elizabethkingia anophelis]MCT3661935.1 insulinase family protein [Elizabethkingia anophelis]MCT3800991.1 insulinase family protein [Elizabethkingia anophelis]MCT3904946.1 insulinase family protein [Elizabethkingia anophelis]MCT4057885.1 insulinase family protein [Elizabethkingia anophelis]MCT4068155.1 insulinase family protein [Elizabethkingia anophelis]